MWGLWTAEWAQDIHESWPEPSHVLCSTLGTKCEQKALLPESVLEVMKCLFHREEQLCTQDAKNWWGSPEERSVRAEQKHTGELLACRANRTQRGRERSRRDELWPCSWGCTQQVKRISCLVELEGTPKCSCSSSWHCVHNVLVLSQCWEQSWCPAAVPGSGLWLRGSTGAQLLGECCCLESGC